MRALDLADILRSAGLDVIEVDGWRTRGDEMFAILGGVGHHTGTAPTAPGDYPSLGVVRDGRADLPGPLAQLGLGRGGTWYVIASGRANHAGPVHQQYAATHTNGVALGVEAEHPGGTAPWPDVQYRSYVRGCAALARAYGITWLGHKEVAAPAGRKPDPTFDMPTFRAAIAAADLTPPEDDMAITQADADLIVETLLKREMAGGDPLPGTTRRVPKETLAERLRQIRRSTDGAYSALRITAERAYKAAVRAGAAQDELVELRAALDALPETGPTATQG